MLPPAGLNEEDREAWLSEMGEKDPQVEKFRTLNEHAPITGMETAWVSKTCGDAQTYNKGEGQVSYAVNVIKSLRWPGALTVCKGGKFTNVYIGYGVKRGDPSFKPTSPPTVDVEPEEP